MTLYSCSVIVAIHVTHPPDGAPLLDLAALFADLHANPENYWWLGFMLFSTLIPTLAHAMIFLAAAFSYWPQSFLNWILRMNHLGPDSPMARQAGHIAPALVVALSVLLPIRAMAYALDHHPLAVDAVVRLFECFARLIGAV